ncbi:MAG: thioredoxin-dependent thiol peroxidase [Pseudomonadota bacterium]
MTNRLEKGDTAPAITLPATNDRQVNLSQPKGKGLVLFFYPKDSTKGCTTEAQDFSALKSAFEALNVEIIGISRDSLASHEKFIIKSDLTVALASDEDGAASEAFGVWVEKSMYGKTYMGIERSTFLIGSDGKVAELWRKVRVKGHAETVLEATKTALG